MADLKPLDSDRATMAFLLAPLVAPVVFAVAFWLLTRHGAEWGLLVLALLGAFEGGTACAYAAAFVVGVPAYFLIRRRGTPSFLQVLLVATIAGALALPIWVIVDVAGAGVNSNKSIGELIAKWDTQREMFLLLGAGAGAGAVIGAVSGVAWWMLATVRDTK